MKDNRDPESKLNKANSWELQSNIPDLRPSISRPKKPFKNVRHRDLFSCSWKKLQKNVCRKCRVVFRQGGAWFCNECVSFLLVMFLDHRAALIAFK